MPESPSRHRRVRARGQSLVEFALVLPVILVVILLALDFGRGFFAWVTVTNASRAGAAFAASNPQAGWGGTPNPAIVAVYRSQITTDLLPTNCSLQSPIPLPVFSGSPAPYGLGGSASVTLTCTFNPITPLVSAIIGSNLPVTSTTVYPVRAGTIAGGPILNAIPLPTATPAPTAVPTPTPVPTAGPTPTPTAPPAALCDAPAMTGLTVSAARSAWIGAGFTGGFDVSPNGAKDTWKVTVQVPAFPSTQIVCNEAADITAKK